MLGKTMLRFVALLVSVTALCAIDLAAQDSQDAPSVAEAARRARAQKQAASKPSQVVTNETLAPNTDAGKPAVDAGAPAASPDTTAAADEGQSAESDQEAAQKKAQIDTLKQKIKDKEESVNLLQREIALEQDSFYSKPDYDRDTAGKQKLDSMQADLKDQQEQLATLKAELTDLGSAEAAKQPAPASSPATPAQPQP